MNRRLLSLLLAVVAQSSFFTFSAKAEGDDDFGMDYSVGMEKKLSKRMGIEIDANFRTQNNNNAIERWGVGASVDYKLYGTKKLDIKASAGWEFLRQQMLGGKVMKECDLYDEATKSWIKGFHDRNWNYTEDYWRNRHRATLGIGASYKPNKRWSFSLKESVQYNHYGKVDSVETWKSRIAYNDDDELYWKSQEQSFKSKEAKDRFLLRSKLTAQYDIRHSIFAPYASADLGCGLNYTTTKWKFTAGTDVKLNKKNKFTVFYRFQTEDDDDEPNGHIIGLGYNIKF